MPRRRPGHVRAGLRRRPLPYDRVPADPADPALSPRLCTEIARLRPREGSWPGTFLTALRQWRYFVRNPYRRLWVDDDTGCGYFECCGDPWQAREILEETLHKLPRPERAELRKILADLDALY